MQRASSKNVLRARALRRTTTLPEGLLWQVLRKRPGGFKFRHQHPLGPFTADFYCAAKHLVVEVDGDAHSMGENPERDSRRDARLRESGFRIVRYDAADVLNNLDRVTLAILSELSI
jgi:very-short-patch-repair endonuclease